MAVQDKEALQSQKDALLASGKPGGILAQEHRQTEEDAIDSMCTYREGYVPLDTVPPRVIVTDGGAQHLSLRETSERAAPQLCGGPSTDIPDSPLWVPDSTAGQVLLLHEYVLTEDQLISEIEIYVPEASQNLPNRFYVVITGPNPGDQPVSTTLPTIATGSPNWRVIQFGNTYYRSGTNFALFQAVLNGGSTGEFNHPQRYIGQNLEIPTNDGDVSRNGSFTQINVSNFDRDGNDITADLSQIEAGAVITWTNTSGVTNGRQEYLVLSASPETGYYNFAVQNTIVEGNFNTNDDIQLSVVYPQTPSASYPSLPDYFLTQPSFANVQAYRIIDNVPTATQDAFGMRIRSTPACFSADWVQISNGTAVLSAGAQRYVQGLYFNDGTQQPAAAFTREAVQFPKVNPFRNPSQIIVATDGTGEIRFASTGQAQSNLSLSWRRDGGGALQYAFVWMELRIDGDPTWYSFGSPRQVTLRNDDVVPVTLPFTIANIEPTDTYRFTIQVSNATENIRIFSELASTIGLDSPTTIAPQDPEGIRAAIMDIQFYPSEV